ncbi:HtaA domain-containing protein [Nocardioides carbamazepini]|uniref:HtaA domain-containing protein n=1 Tax=Nocardioides carbamazepini TaxID=2854259 RepID=UPI00214A4982|nr:HtaA domain-containing protein [Nocardioides carbamazepini]MCR1784044.1 HtaA domain-containing protein [Nocardioides carbamazepini]
MTATRRTPWAPPERSRPTPRRSHRDRRARRGRRGRLTAAATAAGVVLGLMVAGAPPAAHAAESPIADATLDWGIKASFRNYIEGPIAHGSISVSDGASRNADGTFRFADGAGTFDDAGNLTRVTFAGVVSFDGHDGQLDLDVRDVRVDLNGEQSVVRADMTSKDMTSGEVVEYSDVVVATLDPEAGSYTDTGGTSTWSAIPARLTAVGAPAFGGFYAGGTELDPVAFDYAGPGGRPVVTTESWDPQGQPSYANTSVLHDDFQGTGLTYDTDHDWLWTRNYNTGQVVALDATTLGKKVSVTVPGQNPRNVVYSPQFDRAYVIDTVVTVIGQDEEGAWKVLDTLPVPGTGASNDIAVNPATGEVWASWQQGSAALRVYALQPDGSHTYRDIAYPEGSTPGTVLFSGNGHGIAIGAIYQAQAVGAFRIVGEAGAETIVPADGVNVGSGYGVLDDGTLVQAATDYTDYPVVRSGVLRWELTDDGYVASDPLIPFATSPDVGGGQSSIRGSGDLLALASSNSRELRMYLDGRLSKPRGFGTTIAGTVVHDDAVYVLSANRYVHRLELAGATPQLGTEPTDTTVTLDAGQSERPATFRTALADGSTGDLQWQVKAPGARRFADVEGETGPALELTAGTADDGTQVRVVAKNAIGTVVSAVATLTVRSAPSIVAAPRSTTVSAGTPAVFTATFTGLPAPELVWERQVNGFWQPIAEDDQNVVLAEGSLMVPDTDVAQSGTRFRARVSNGVGTVRSGVATLTVTPAVSIPEDGLALDGVSLEWSGNKEVQSAPPVGGSNYLSAGVSDGDQATYRAVDGDVAVVHRDAAGVESPASYGTRAAPAAGAVTQLVRLSGGQARLEADGSASVAWDGSFSVNFYGGMVPFTLTDPHLSVEADGTGTLSADLAGYAATMENPDDRTPLDPVEDVTIATYQGIELDPAGKVTITADYAGVELDVPSGQTPQDRSSAGWGSWPQGFADFQFATGLSSYWYSSGSAADGKKAPLPSVVDFTDAEQVAGAGAPVITGQPASVSAKVGDPVALQVTATGTGLAHQWQRRIGSSWISVEGETTDRLVIAAVEAADAGARFRVRVSNARGSVVSEPATLSVVPTVQRATVSFTKVKVAKAPTRGRPGRLRVLLAASDGTRVDGTIRVVLKKGSVTRKVRATVVDGRAVAALPRLPRGTWRVTVRSKASASYEAATTTTKVTVAR